MTMSAGTVTVNQNDGTWSGSGAALAVMNVIQPLLLAQMPANPSTAIVVGVSNGAAAIAKGEAALITYILANGDVHVPTSAFGASIPPSPVDLGIT